MPLLSASDRKRRMPIGAQQRIATALSVPESYVSMVMHDRWRPKTEETRATLRRIQDAIAVELGMPVASVFPPVADETEEADRRRAVAS